MSYPLTNGYAYVLGTAYVDIAGSRFFGIKSIKWTETMEGSEAIPGAALFYVAETPGIYKASVEFEILTSEYMRLIQKLGPGYLMKRFGMAAQLMDPANVLPLLSITFPALKIGEGAGSLEQGASTVSVKTTVGPGKMIDYNGITAVASGGLGAGIGNTFGGSAQVAAQVGASVGFSL